LGHSSRAAATRNTAQRDRPSAPSRIDQVAWRHRRKRTAREQGNQPRRSWRRWHASGRRRPSVRAAPPCDGGRRVAALETIFQERGLSIVAIAESTGSMTRARGRRSLSFKREAAPLRDRLHTSSRTSDRPGRRRLLVEPTSRLRASSRTKRLSRAAPFSRIPGRRGSRRASRA